MNIRYEYTAFYANAGTLALTCKTDKVTKRDPDKGVNIVKMTEKAGLYAIGQNRKFVV